MRLNPNQHHPTGCCCWRSRTVIRIWQNITNCHVSSNSVYIFINGRYANRVWVRQNMSGECS